MSQTFTLCTIQPAIIWQQPQRTFEHIETLLAQAASQAAIDLAVLPEHFNAVLEDEREKAQQAAAWAFAASLARRHQINLVAGSVERWKSTSNGRVNTAVVFDRGGQEVGRYDKRMLFGFEKRRQVIPGQGSLVVSLDGVRCAVLVCADLWYPELVREIAGAADILCVPAQTTIRAESDPAYARRLWHSLALTRAQENVLGVAVSDQATSSSAPYRCGGVATLVDPSAEPDLQAIQRTLDAGEAGFILATVDLTRLAAFRVYRRQNGLLPDLAPSP
jgi:predicted amidohydrolase